MDTEDQGQIFEHGGPTALCWSWADAVVTDIGADRARRIGYFCDPQRPTIMSAVADGHDMALVDDRFLVDGWSAFVEGIGPVVLDLQDRSDAEIAQRMHGPLDELLATACPTDGQVEKKA